MARTIDLTALISFLRCAYCGSLALTSREHAVFCGTCAAWFTNDDGGRVFFTNPPAGARELVGSEEDSENNRRQVGWSVARVESFRYVAARLAPYPKETIICDLGVGLAPLAALTDRFDRVVGVDFFPYAPVHVVADLRDPLPLADAAFEVVLCTETLEHIPNPELLISEIARILTPGGVCIGSVPFLHPVHYGPYDFYRYTPYALERFLTNAGFVDPVVAAMGSSFDVLTTYQSRFFARALGSVAARPRFSRLLARFLIRAMRKATVLLNRAARALTHECAPDSDAALAYCFFARKPF